MNYRYVARPLAMIGARSNRYISAFVSPLTAHRISAPSKFAKFELPPNAHAAPHNCRTATVGIETINSRTESLIKDPTPESNDLAMSRRRIRERIISSCTNFSQRVYSQLANVRVGLYNLSQKKKRTAVPGTWCTAILL